MRFAILVLLLMAGCASAPPSPSPSASSSSTTRQPAPGSPPPEGITVKTESIAVASILQSARADAASGRLANAAASIERALRIEPRNPRLWNELARVRLQQRDWAQAEATAARSNSFAGSDSELRASNADLIAQARRAQGK
ncbi:MAG TPA: tetratricopeptide repeat protein [Burkholderiales bacterium]|nr:tetratricopeptide repeat protein [Burkholderiales bacterium]